MVFTCLEPKGLRVDHRLDVLRICELLATLPTGNRTHDEAGVDQLSGCMFFLSKPYD